MTDDTRKVHQQTSAMRDAADTLADRLDHAADEVAAASGRLGKHARRVGNAVAEFSRDAERPATDVARALEDLGNEARRSFDPPSSPGLVDLGACGR